MLTYTFNMAETLAIAVCLLLLGKWIKNKVYFFEKFFIPAPVIGGVIFSFFSLIGYSTKLFMFSFEGSLKDFLMIAFFTTIGFLASLKMLKKGGVQVLIFLLAAVLLVIIQNIVGISLAKFFNLNPLLGIAAGSVPLTGGHGTSAAFGPILENARATGAAAVSIASATFGLVAGCLIGGPVGKRLMSKHNLSPSKKTESLKTETLNEDKFSLNEDSLFKAIVYIALAMGLGNLIMKLGGIFMLNCITPLVKVFFKNFNGFQIVLPIYIGPMIVAAIIRNIADASSNIKFPINPINTVGNISLQLFLAMALMSMRLWDLAALAVPLMVILLVQTVVMALFAYFVTFRMMGKDYDAAVMSVGHCGFGMGATPNAMANMESFTAVNGPSVTAFFALPLVGSLFIDFINATIITFFINLFPVVTQVVQ